MMPPSCAYLDGRPEQPPLLVVSLFGPGFWSQILGFLAARTWARQLAAITIMGSLTARAELAVRSLVAIARIHAV